MRSVLLLVLFGAAVAKPEGTSMQVPEAAEPSDVTYYFYNQANVEDGEASQNAIPSSFDPKKEVLFMIHGWGDKYSSESMDLIKTAVLEAYDVNVIVVDWSSVADSFYLVAKNGVPGIGELLGNFVQNLTLTYDISPSRISMVGHSLGAHIAGIAGTILNGELNHIVGLDPASPFVDASDTSYVLDSKDARFVQVIHTSSGKLSLLQSLGHADYFPNGGTEQTGCILDIFGNCAHKMSYKFFAESMTDNKFYAQNCASYQEYEEGTCTGAYSLMGGYNVDTEASGNYYLETNAASPYAKGEN